jgi:hypothetical protein
MRFHTVSALLAMAGLLAGCDLLGIESGSVTAERKEVEGKAIGGACRHALRAIEDCYTLNPKASKAAVYTGWREMDEYMRENKLDGIVPVVPRKTAKPAAPASVPEGEEAAADSGSAKEAAGDEKSKPAPAEHGSESTKREKRQATTH